jgi:indole-3-glycerol phosphate synthase
VDLLLLDQIVTGTRSRLEKAKALRPQAVLTEEVKRLPSTDFPFYNAIATPELSLICEVKKASPSRGLISAHFPSLDIAREYEEAGAAAISVLTEPAYFLGSNEVLTEIAAATRLPLLRKDFVIDPYQILETRLLGASALLLIVSLLPEKKTLKSFIDVTHAVGLSALVEVHDKKELETAVEAGAKIIGVNNRDLHDFSVDLNTSLHLAPFIPDGILFVSESGIKTPEDMVILRKAGADAALIGESLIRSPDRKNFIAALKGAKK